MLADTRSLQECFVGCFQCVLDAFGRDSTGNAYIAFVLNRNTQMDQPSCWSKGTAASSSGGLGPALLFHLPFDPAMYRQAVEPFCVIVCFAARGFELQADPHLC